MSARHAAYLQEMGLGPRWALRHVPESALEHEAIVTVADVVLAAALAPAQVGVQQQDAGSIAPIVMQSPNASVAPVDAMDWQQLQQSVAACTGCGLCAGRSNTVFGAGPRKANWLFIGAAPNAPDEAAGQPLTEDSGSLFNNMLRAIGLQAEQDVFLTNLLKCRPASGADVRVELAACRPYLARQIALLEPTIIVALGANVGAALLGLADENLADMRGQLHHYAGLPLVVTYAPGELLSMPAAKAATWRDLCLALDTVQHAAFTAGLNTDATR